MRLDGAERRTASARMETSCGPGAVKCALSFGEIFSRQSRPVARRKALQPLCRECRAAEPVGPGTLFSRSGRRVQPAPGMLRSRTYFEAQLERQSRRGNADALKIELRLCCPVYA